MAKRGIDPNYLLYSEPDCKSWGLHEPHEVRLDLTYVCSGPKECGRKTKPHEQHTRTFEVAKSCTGDPHQELLLC